MGNATHHFWVVINKKKKKKNPCARLGLPVRLGARIVAIACLSQSQWDTVHLEKEEGGGHAPLDSTTLSD